MLRDCHATKWKDDVCELDPLAHASMTRRCFHDERERKNFTSCLQRLFLIEEKGPSEGIKNPRYDSTAAMCGL